MEKESGGLAKKVASLGKLTKLESRLNTAIESSKVPTTETRKLLKSKNSNQMKNTALFQFMRNLFHEIGLGKINAKEKDNFCIVIYNEECEIKDLYPDVKDKKTCYIVSDAISEFFSEDLNLPADVKETACENRGDEHCVFEIDLQPLAVYQIALDKVDDEIIEGVKEKERIEEIAGLVDLSEEEVEYRLDILKSYHVIDPELELTKIGQTYYKYGQTVIEEEYEEIEPPWKTMSNISQSISDSSSFAEAVSSVDEEGEEEEVNDSDVVNLANEADKSKSFAQLVSKQVSEEDEDQ